MQTKVMMVSGRVNSRDGQETATAYCEPDGSVSVWVVIDSVDFFAFVATSDDLVRVPFYPVQNTLIKSGQGVALYRLTTGELQIASTNGYVFRWNSCFTH